MSNKVGGCRPVTPLKRDCLWHMCFHVNFHVNFYLQLLVHRVLRIVRIMLYFIRILKTTEQKVTEVFLRSVYFSANFKE